MTWLTPTGDLVDVARFLGVTQAKLNDSKVWSDLNLCVETAVEELERRVGPIVERTVTETVLARRGWAGLSYDPVLVESVSAGATHHPSAFGVKGDFPDGDLTVTYRAGWVPADAAVPAWARSAALLLIRHLWRTQFGNQQASSSDPGSAWLWPRQVQSLVEGRELPAKAGG